MDNIYIVIITNSGKKTKIKPKQPTQKRVNDLKQSNIIAILSMLLLIVILLTSSHLLMCVCVSTNKPNAAQLLLLLLVMRTHTRMLFDLSLFDSLSLCVCVCSSMHVCCLSCLWNKLFCLPLLRANLLLPRHLSGPSFFSYSWLLIAMVMAIIRVFFFFSVLYQIHYRIDNFASIVCACVCVCWKFFILLNDERTVYTAF